MRLVIALLLILLGAVGAVLLDRGLFEEQLSSRPQAPGAEQPAPAKRTAANQPSPETPRPAVDTPAARPPHPPRTPMERPNGTFTHDECVTCHRKRQPGLMDQWDASEHARRDVTCVDCHGANHDAIFAVEGLVATAQCAKCHEKETYEFLASPHARARDAALANGRLKAQIPAMQRRGCLACHDSGGGSQGRCNACHGAHRHSAADARRPEACGTCHMGPDHPHLEAWESSLHGVAYGATHDTRQAPTCVTCHMDGGSHHVGFGITIGSSGSGGVLEGEQPAIPMKVITAAHAKNERKRMLAICERCHTPRMARRALEDADAIKREVDRLVGEAARIVRALYDDVLLDPMPKERPAHPTAGHTLVLGGGALYENHSDAERIFFDLAKFGHSITFKAAYHQSADWTHWLGMARLKADLEELKALDRRTRKAAAIAAAASKTKPGK